MSGPMQPILWRGPWGFQLYWAGQHFEKPGLWCSWWSKEGVGQRRLIPWRKKKAPPIPYRKPEPGEVGSSPRPGATLSDVMEKRLKR